MANTQPHTYSTSFSCLHSDIDKVKQCCTVSLLTMVAVG